MTNNDPHLSLIASDDFMNSLVSLFMYSVTVELYCTS